MGKGKTMGRVKIGFSPNSPKRGESGALLKMPLPGGNVDQAPFRVSGESGESFHEGENIADEAKDSRY
jgi:hypothetical protein